MTSGSSSPIRPSSQPNSAISSALLKMRCQSGFTSPAPRLRLVTASAGAYSSTPMSAPDAGPDPVDGRPEHRAGRRAQRRSPDQRVQQPAGAAAPTSVRTAHAAEYHAQVVVHAGEALEGQPRSETRPVVFGRLAL